MPRTALKPVVCVAAFAAAAILLLGYQAGQTPWVRGDVWEYWYQAEAFHRHGTPDIRPADAAVVIDEAARLRLPPPPPEPMYATATAPDGRVYGVHFWAYAVSAVPAKAYLRWAGESELGALALTNAAWFVLALGVTLFGSAAPVRERLALAGLASVGPVLWYVAFPGAELFSWALVLIAVVAYRDRRYGWAGLSAGLSATQNPTAILLGGAAVLAAAWERRWAAAARAAAGTAVGLTPYAFFLYHFGHPNLIAAEYVTGSNLSWVRTWGLVADLNQGLLPYLPLLTVGAAAGAVRLTLARDARGLLLAAGGAAMAVGAELAHNWNSDCVGLQRYIVWVTPVAAGVAVAGLAGQRLGAFTLAAVTAHAAILLAFHLTDALKHGYLGHNPVVEWVLAHYPRAYWVDPEVFVERQRHRDDWPNTPSDYPVGYARPDGTVTKLLVDPASVARVGEVYDVDPAYLSALADRAAREPGPFFDHPPGAAVRVRP